MTAPQVVLPVSFDQIPAERQRIAEYLRGLRLEVDMGIALMRAIQGSCPHPPEKLEHGTDRSGMSETGCTHCGKEW